MRVYTFKKTFVVSGGVASFNTQEFRGECRLLQIHPATATTRYTLTITNDDNVIVYKGSFTGDLVDERMKPLYGIYTIAISASTANEDFKFTINYVDLQ